MKTRESATMRKTIKYFTNFCIAIILGLSLLTFVLPRVMGGESFTILTGSMQPSINPGDLVIDKKAEWRDIRIGDVITFQEKSNNPKLITHRVVAKNTGVEKLLTTRGDANGADDNPIKYAQVKGRVTTTIPKLGYITNYLENHKMALFGLCVFLVGLSFIDTKDGGDEKNEGSGNKTLPRGRSKNVDETSDNITKNTFDSGVGSTMVKRPITSPNRWGIAGAGALDG